MSRKFSIVLFCLIAALGIMIQGIAQSNKLSFLGEELVSNINQALDQEGIVSNNMDDYTKSFSESDKKFVNKYFKINTEDGNNFTLRYDFPFFSWQQACEYHSDQKIWNCFPD